MMRATKRILTEERGAETIEFALVFPVAAFLVFALIYGLLAVAAQVSLAHAAAGGVRYASIPTDSLTNTYPSTTDVAAHVASDARFFSATSCTTTVAGDQTANAPVTIDVVCDFPNPMGPVISAVRNLMTNRTDPDGYPGSLRMSAHAEARRE